MNYRKLKALMIWLSTRIILMTSAILTLPAIASESMEMLDAAKIKFQWGVKIPMRDGVRLNTNVYTPKDQKAPAPCLFTLTPYIAQSYHDRGVYFAANGFPFLTVDVRGRGNSEGEFRPFIQEAKDGYDVVEWLAKQPYCNGKVAMWGGSYAGYDQWATAKELPPSLATFVPVASVYPGRDFPMRNNISYPYVMRWLTYTSGRAAQKDLFGDTAFWTAINRELFESGTPFKALDQLLGNPSPIFQEWVAHPFIDAYWDSYTPTSEQYARLQMPILTITGSYDGDQPGALLYYRQHMQHATPAARTQHYLIIGPWDHAGTRTPKTEFGGLTFGPTSLLDLPKLHLEWYAWTMQQGSKPEFLKKPVAYYVMGAEQWRYADSLDAVTAQSIPYFLDSTGNAADVFTSGSLSPDKPGRGQPDKYVYDPRDVSRAALEGANESYLTDQRLVLAASGQQFVYHSIPFAEDTELSGFFKLQAWLSIDQRDTDFRASVFEISPGGESILLTTDLLRARYRESLRAPALVKPGQVHRYDFNSFTFVSRQLKRGSRIRLVLGPINSIGRQKNYSSGGIVAEESLKDAHPVTVTLYHNRKHPSVLYVPLGPK